MRIGPFMVAGLAMTLAAPLAAQAQPGDAPPATPPAMSAPMAWQEPATGAAAPAGPGLAPRSEAPLVVQLRAIIDQQRGYIAALEKHVAALDGYIQSVRARRR